ncbi:MAG: signal peptide peptidase SppA [Candidatus Eisenbacteria bacterium]|nr:signal peptide peptidase SppA [Candidatus Eisenbacteria bacterium]
MKSLRSSLKLLPGAVLLAALLFGPGSSSAASPTPSDLSPVWSVLAWTPDGASMATSDGPQSVFTNPAAIGLRSGVGTFYGGTLENSRQRLSSFSIQLKALSFGYVHSGDWDTKPKQEAFLTGVGFSVSSFARLGFFGNWQRMEDERNSKAFSYGTALLVRPCGHFSLGAKLSNINQPHYGDDVLSRFYEVGAGIRPLPGMGSLGNRLTFTLDTEFDEHTDVADLALRYGVELEPIDGLILNAGYRDVDGRGDVRFGVGFNFLRNSLGYSGQSEEDGPDRSSYYVSSSTELQRSVVKPASKVIKLNVQGNLRDQSSEGLFTLGAKYSNAFPVLEELRRARKEKWVKGILLNIRGISNFAVIEEMRDEVKRCRDEGKTVVAFLDGNGDFSDYYLAASADKIVTPFAGTIGPFGFGRTMLLYKNFLAKLGIEFERFPCRECAYKSAYANFTEDKLPEGYKQQIDEIMDDVYNEWLSAVSEDRGMDKEKLRALADGSIIMPVDAKAEGLVDEIGFYDAADSLVSKMADAKVDQHLKLSKLTHRRYDWGQPKKVAVVFAMGAILPGKNGSDFMEGNFMGHETMTKMLSRVEKDKSIKAVVWRIDSPGGDGYASDAIWNAIEKTKKKKPVVSSMGYVAGSGGYWIAMNSNKIIADPLTLTGSIGATGLKPILSGTYEKLGINLETFKRGEHIDMYSTSRHMSDEEMSMMLNMVDRFYDYFVEKVASGRGLKPEDVRKIGGGHVYTGRRALSIGLVDKLGGVEEAIQEAKKLAGLKGDVEVVYVNRPRKSIFQTLLGLSAGEETQGLSLLRSCDGPMLIMDDLPEVTEVEP